MPSGAVIPVMLLPRSLFWPLQVLLVLAVGLAAWIFGAPVPFSDLWSADAARAETAELVFVVSRAPRVVCGLLVGASLAVSGAALQGLFRNPLAEPFLLGISAGGALGATLSAALRLPELLLFGSSFESSTGLAFLGALGAAAAVYGLGKPGGARLLQGGEGGNARLLLTGVALSAFLSALMSLVVTLSGRLELAQQASFWLLGGLTRASWPQNLVLATVLVTGLAMLLASSRDLNALRAGEEDAASLGVDLPRLHLRLLLAASLLSAASVAAAGLIGFVGLLAPHTVRLLGARDARLLLPGCALFGAALLCGCDALARSVAPPVEIPVGILTALLGVPLFLSLARKY